METSTIQKRVELLYGPSRLVGVRLEPCGLCFTFVALRHDGERTIRACRTADAIVTESGPPAEHAPLERCRRD